MRLKFQSQALFKKMCVVAYVYNHNAGESRNFKSWLASRWVLIGKTKVPLRDFLKNKWVVCEEWHWRLPLATTFTSIHASTHEHMNRNTWYSSFKWSSVLRSRWACISVHSNRHNPCCFSQCLPHLELNIWVIHLSALLESSYHPLCHGMRVQLC